MAHQFKTPASSKPTPKPTTALRDELVVALPYQQLVLRQLEDWGAAPKPPDAHEPLGLALIGLRAQTAARRLRTIYPDRCSQATETAEALGFTLSDIDLTVLGLEHVFRQRYDGWSPTMGKNRAMFHVTASDVIDYGVQPKAVLTDAGEKPQLLALEPKPGRRAAGPGQGTRVGLIDTTIDPHEWLAGGYIASADAVRTSTTGDDVPELAGHATFVTGLVLRQAPGTVVELHALLGDRGAATTWSLAKAIAALRGSGAQVINLSLGCQTDDGRPPLVLAAAIAALGPDAVVVAAAGNFTGARDPGDLQDIPPIWPAALDNVIAVGASNGDGPADFSPIAPWVDVYAPGVDLVSTYVDTDAGIDGFTRRSGTSFAAAAVSGAIAAGARGVGGLQAWRGIRNAAARTPYDGRPFVRLTRPKDWPLDGS